MSNPLRLVCMVTFTDFEPLNDDLSSATTN